MQRERTTSPNCRGCTWHARCLRKSCCSGHLAEGKHVQDVQGIILPKEDRHWRKWSGPTCPVLSKACFAGRPSWMRNGGEGRCGRGRARGRAGSVSARVLSTRSLSRALTGLPALATQKEIRDSTLSAYLRQDREGARLQGCDFGPGCRGPTLKGVETSLLSQVLAVLLRNHVDCRAILLRDALVCVGDVSHHRCCILCTMPLVASLPACAFRSKRSTPEHGTAGMTAHSLCRDLDVCTTWLWPCSRTVSPLLCGGLPVEIEQHKKEHLSNFWEAQYLQADAEAAGCCRDLQENRRELLKA